MNAPYLSTLFAVAIVTPAFLWSQDVPAPEPAPAPLVTSKLQVQSRQLPLQLVNRKDQTVDGEPLGLVFLGGKTAHVHPEARTLLSQGQDELAKARKEAEKAQKQLQEAQEHLANIAQQHAHAKQRMHEDQEALIRHQKGLKKSHEQALGKQLDNSRGEMGKDLRNFLARKHGQTSSQNSNRFVFKNDPKGTWNGTATVGASISGGATGGGFAGVKPTRTVTTTTTRTGSSKNSDHSSEVTVIVENGDVHIYNGSGARAVDVQASSNSRGHGEHHILGVNGLHGVAEIEVHEHHGKAPKAKAKAKLKGLASLKNLTSLKNLKGLESLKNLDGLLVLERMEALEALGDLDILGGDFEIDIDSVEFDEEAFEDAMEEIGEEFEIVIEGLGEEFEGVMEELEEEFEDALEELEEELEEALEEMEEMEEIEEVEAHESAKQEYFKQHSHGVSSVRKPKTWPANHKLGKTYPSFFDGPANDFQLASSPQAEDALLEEIAELVRELTQDVRGLRSDLSELAEELGKPQTASRRRSSRPVRPQRPAREPRPSGR